MAGLAGLPGRAAAEWQWSKEVPAITIGDTAAHPQAFLWIPPDCRRVRAVVCNVLDRSPNYGSKGRSDAIAFWSYTRIIHP